MADDIATDRSRQLRLYLDVCCLQRPFDDQRQVRIHLEAEAVKLKRTVRFAEELHVRVENPLKWLQRLEDK